MIWVIPYIQLISHGLLMWSRVCVIKHEINMKLTTFICKLTNIHKYGLGFRYIGDDPK